MGLELAKINGLHIFHFYANEWEDHWIWKFVWSYAQIVDLHILKPITMFKLKCYSTLLFNCECNWIENHRKIKSNSKSEHMTVTIWNEFGIKSVNHFGYCKSSFMADTCVDVCLCHFTHQISRIWIHNGVYVLRFQIFKMVRIFCVCEKTDSLLLTLQAPPI